ncbi:hypothetical protein ACHAXT_004893 [Thalassiosira profunda]
MGAAVEQLRTLPPEHLADAADLASAAFVDSPAWAFICQGRAVEKDDHEGRSSRRRFLQWLFLRNFSLRLGTPALRSVFEKDGRLVAFFMFVPPDVEDVSLWDMLRSGILAAPVLFGLGLFRRLLSSKDKYESHEHEVLTEHGISRVYKLERMAVRPDMQGKGVGSAALRQALCEADEAGLPVLLTTQEERNVRFYSRLGFKVAKESFFGGCNNWSMLRFASSDDAKEHKNATS